MCPNQSLSPLKTIDLYGLITRHLISLHREDYCVYLRIGSKAKRPHSPSNDGRWGSPADLPSTDQFYQMTNASTSRYYYFCSMKELINYILQFGNLNKRQIELLSTKAKASELHKGEYFSEAGKIARQVGFLLEGVIRFVTIITRRRNNQLLYGRKQFFVDLNSFDNKIPSSGYVQAVTDCMLIVFSQQDWQELSNTIVGWDKIVQKSSLKQCSKR